MRGLWLAALTIGLIGHMLGNPPAGAASPARAMVSGTGSSASVPIAAAGHHGRHHRRIARGYRVGEDRKTEWIYAPPTAGE